MMWLAHTAPHPDLGVAEVLGALENLGLERTARIDPWAFQELIGPRRLRACFDSIAARTAIHRPLRSMLKRLAEGHPIGHRSRWGIVRDLGGEPALRTLVDLHARLHGHRPDP